MIKQSLEIKKSLVKPKMNWGDTMKGGVKYYRGKSKLEESGIRFKRLEDLLCDGMVLL